MESQPLPISLCKTQEHSDSQPSQLIREWLFRFGVEHKEDVAPRLPLWLETFGGMDASTLDGLFRRALRTCKFFPKIAEILEPLASAETNAAPEAAEKAWEHVLELRRTRWSPDAPGGFYGGAPKLSERVENACRAAGVWRDFESVEALHTWAKKRFIESFIAYGELEQDKFLLPDDEIKALLAECSEAKALPAPSPDWQQCRERGEVYRSQLATKGPLNLSPEERLRVAAELTDAARKVLEQRREHIIVVTDEGRTALHRQAEMLKRSFPMRPEAFAERPELRKIYERFGLEIPESAQSAQEPQAVEA